MESSWFVFASLIASTYTIVSGLTRYLLELLFHPSAQGSHNLSDCLDWFKRTFYPLCYWYSCREALWWYFNSTPMMKLPNRSIKDGYFRTLMLAGSTIYVIALMLLSYDRLSYPSPIPFYLFYYTKMSGSLCTKYYQIFICQGLLVGVWNPFQI